MNIYTIVFLTGGILSPLVTTNASAQTCRVSAGKCANGSISFKEVFEYDFVEQKPEFPGGGQSLLNFINEQRQYPEKAYNEGIEGRVTCAFVVNADGSISDISVIRGVEPSLNTEAVRILSLMPCWNPGKLNGRAVPVRVICPVPFRK